MNFALRSFCQLECLVRRYFNFATNNFIETMNRFYILSSNKRARAVQTKLYRTILLTTRNCNLKRNHLNKLFNARTDRAA